VKKATVVLHALAMIFIAACMYFAVNHAHQVAQSNFPSKEEAVSVVHEVVANLNGEIVGPPDVFTKPMLISTHTTIRLKGHDSKGAIADSMSRAGWARAETGSDEIARYCKGDAVAEFYKSRDENELRMRIEWGKAHNLC
jgi:hypothetical protein